MKSIVIVVILNIGLSGTGISQTYQSTGRNPLEVAPVLKNFMNYRHARDFTLSPSGHEAYFTLLSPQEEISIIVRISRTSDNWSEPRLVKFSGRYRDLEPFLSPDGLRLYFASNRPVNAATENPKDFDLWYVERSNMNAAWSEPVNLGKPVNTQHNEFYPAVSANNNLYFTSDSPEAKGKDDIFFSRWNDTAYDIPVSLSDSINTVGYEFNAFIAPDESFLIFSGYNREDGFGSGDLYISFHTDKGWNGAQNLGNQINSSAMDYCPYVAMNDKVLYFTSKRSSIKQKPFTSIEDFLSEINQYANGFSRMYRVSIGEVISRDDY